MEIISFIFSSFWKFIGSFILIIAAGSALSQIISAFIPEIHKHTHINGYKFDNEQIQKIIEGNDDDRK